MSDARDALGHAHTLAVATRSLDEVRLLGSVENMTAQLNAIVSLAEHALGSLIEGDPMRDDLLEVRTAARMAIARLDQLGASARFTPTLRLVGD